MAGKDIEIPFGPDQTGGMGLAELIPEEPVEQAPEDPLAQLPSIVPASGTAVAGGAQPAQATDSIQAADSTQAIGSTQAAGQTTEAVKPTSSRPSFHGRSASPSGNRSSRTHRVSSKVAGEAREGGSDSRSDSGSEDQAIANGMDEMQMSILAFKDAIGQSRELKAREKEREELAESIASDREELADRENILANYQALVSEQDAIVNDRTQQREAHKAELAQVAAEADATQETLDRTREDFSFQMQPIETELGRVRAAADQAKNDERSRKAELSAAEAELRRADDADANTMAVAKHQQVQAAYDEARKRSEQAKEQLAQAQRTYDDYKQQAEQATAPLERSLQDLDNRIDELKESVSRLGEEISMARKRRQYCDTVYQYPDETAKLRANVEKAEAEARQMDVENDALREQLAQSKQKAKKAKIALGIVIAIIVVTIAAFIIVSLR